MGWWLSNRGNLLTRGLSERWLLVPGTLCTPEVFSPVLDCLEVAPGRRHFVMADAPTTGNYAARLERSIEPGDVVCGFSLGSLVLAHNLSSLANARAVVLLSLNPLADPLSNASGRLRTRDRIAFGDVRGWVRDNWSKMSVRTDVELMSRVSDMAEETQALIGVQTDLALSRPDASEHLRAADLPLVFVTGSEDQMTPPGPVSDIAASAQNAYVEVLDGLGHFALLEAPDRVAMAIENGFSTVLKDD